MAHGEVVTWVSCHSDRPIWRYATLYIFDMCFEQRRTGICYFITSSRGVRKSRFATYREFAKTAVGRNGPLCTKKHISCLN